MKNKSLSPQSSHENQPRFIRDKVTKYNFSKNHIFSEDTFILDKVILNRLIYNLNVSDIL